VIVKSSIGLTEDLPAHAENKDAKTDGNNERRKVAGRAHDVGGCNLHAGRVMAGVHHQHFGGHGAARGSRRNIAASATSAVSTVRRSGARSRYSCRIPLKPEMPDAASVLIGPAGSR
jgi:hypothetical protein